MEDTFFIVNPALRINILLVEDNPGDARMVRELLNESAPGRFEATHMPNLKDATEQLSRQKFDAILLDLSLPDSQGMETFQKVRKLSPYLPVIVLTGLNDETVAMRAIHLGAQDYLPKDQLTGFLLSRAIRHAIERERLVHQLQEALTQVKTLGGLLPICGACKRVRDDSGYWNQIETYISQHSEASFTHGVCPECAMKELEAAGVPIPEHMRTAAGLKKNPA